MRGLNRAWRLIRRFIARTDAVVAAAGRGHRGPAGIQWRNNALQVVRSGGRRLYWLCGRAMDWMQEAQRNSERVAREAIRNERRAKRRALILLLKQLNPEQRREFRKHRYFHVIGGSSGDRYRIRVDLIANIDVLHYDGIARYRLCVRPTGDIPVYDVMAGQLLHLQDPGAEQRFLQQANIHSTLPEEQVRFRTIWIA